MSEQIKDFFLNELDTSNHEYFESIKNLKVSSHIVIKRTGEILQFVPFNKRAWHAGVSSYLGKENCNDYSIGIELEGTDDSAFTDEQYNSLMNLTDSLIRSYPHLSKDRLVGHSDVAPGRKTDPGTMFEWKKIINKMDTETMQFMLKLATTHQDLFEINQSMINDLYEAVQMREKPDSTTKTNSTPATIHATPHYILKPQLSHL